MKRMDHDLTAPRRWYRLSRFTSRRRTSLAFRGAIVFALILALVLTVFGARFGWFSRSPLPAQQFAAEPTPVQPVLVPGMPDCCAPFATPTGGQSATPQSPFGLAWFHKPPED